jgi:excisionase family DNA binding protein
MSPLSRPQLRHGLNRPTVAKHPDTPTNKDSLTEPVLYTPDQAAALLQVRPSWLRRKAAARTVPCRYVGKHLRFSRSDIDAIAENSAQPPRQRHRGPDTA